MKIDIMLPLEQGYRVNLGDKITTVLWEASRKSNIIRTCRQGGSLPSREEGLYVTGTQELTVGFGALV